jgi:hypothetical protein
VVNKKLTAVIGGRRIAGTAERVGKLSITFRDGSVMTVKTSAAVGSIPAGCAVAKVRTQDALLIVDLADGSTVDIETPGATSMVTVLDKTGASEYAD